MNTIERIEARQVFAPGGELDVRKYITLDEWAAIKAVVETARRLLPTLPAEVRRSGQSKGSNDMTTDKDRAEFEAAMMPTEIARNRHPFAQDGKGDYIYLEARCAWLAWQAARSRSGAVPPVAWVEVSDTHEGPYEFHVVELLPEGRHELFVADATTLFEVTPAAPEPPQGDIVSSEEGYRAYSLLARAIDAMEALHSEIEPDEECENGIVPAATMRKFVDAHAELLHERERLAFSSICPDCAARVASADTPRSGDAPFCIDLIAAWQARFQRNDGTWSEWGVYPDDVIQGIHKTGACEGFPAEIRPLYTAPPADARDAGQKHCCEHTIVAMVGPPVSAEFGFVHAIAWCVPSLPMGALLYAKRCEVDKQ